MNKEYITDERFEKLIFSKSPLEYDEYENCKFINCNFANHKISGLKFIDCIFEHCNFSNTGVQNTIFNGINFYDSKILAVKFEECNHFTLDISFCDCNLTYSSFRKLSLIKTFFKRCKLHDVDFAECNLKNSVFDDCDMLGAMFSRTNIENADFQSSYNFIIDPEKNKIKNAKFSLSEVSGLLTKYNIKIL